MSSHTQIEPITFLVPDLPKFEAILAHSIKDVVDEIQLADVEILHRYAANSAHGNMNDFVLSSTELFYKDQTLTYDYGADIQGSSSVDRSIVLKMKFTHGPVLVRFWLTLKADRASISINSVLLDHKLKSPELDEATFAQFLEAARLKPDVASASHTWH